MNCKRWIWSILSFFILPLQGWVHPCPGEWAVVGEWLVWHAVTDEPYYVLPSQSAITVRGTRLINDIGYHSGWRAEGIYAFCDYPTAFHIRGTSYYGSHRNEITQADLFSLLGLAGTTPPGLNVGANAKTKITYYAVEGLFDHMCVSNTCLELLMQVGVEYVHFDFKEQVNYLSVVGGPGATIFSNRYENQIWGIGPEFVLDLVAHLPRWRSIIPRCLGEDRWTFVADARAALLLTTTHPSLYIDNFEFALTLNADYKSEPLKRFVPAFDIKLGLNYQCALPWFVADIEIGYEFLTFNRLLSQIVTYTSGGSLAFDNYMSLNFYGPYLSAGVHY